ENDSFKELSRAAFFGRPVDAGVVMANREKWLAVADYWTSRIRYFVYRNENLSEISNTVHLPGAPILAGFNRDLSVSAALCLTPDAVQVVAYRQVTQIESTQIGNWQVPNEDVWRRLIVLDGGNNQPRIVLLGSVFPTSVLLLEPDREPYPVPHASETGMLVDAAAAPGKPVVKCLIENAGQLRLVSLDISPDAKPAGTIEAGRTPALGGLSVGSLTGKDTDDFLVLGGNRLGVAFTSADEGISEMRFWALPAPARLFGRPVMMNNGKGMVYVGENGGLWNAVMAQ
ncbi:MAG: hypothetical protein FWG74_00910, partial [Planctomycetes bacterium]|nr:hypothetical protein [Planctomycetota bacterium]